MTTFYILTAHGFLTLFVMQLYLWADIRELKTIAREGKRELLRKNFGERSTRGKEAFPQTAQKRQPDSVQTDGRAGLKEAEEQVLQEVLTEFLG